MEGVKKKNEIQKEALDQKKKKKWRRMRKTVNLIEYKGGNYFKDRITVFNIKFHFDKYYSILAAIIKWIGVTLFKIELIA